MHEYGSGHLTLQLAKLILHASKYPACHYFGRALGTNPGQITPAYGRAVRPICSVPHVLPSDLLHQNGMMGSMSVRGKYLRDLLAGHIRYPCVHVYANMNTH